MLIFVVFFLSYSLFVAWQPRILGSQSLCRSLRLRRRSVTKLQGPGMPREGASRVWLRGLQKLLLTPLVTQVSSRHDDRLQFLSECVSVSVLCLAVHVLFFWSCGFVCRGFSCAVQCSNVVSVCVTTFVSQTRMNRINVVLSHGVIRQYMPIHGIVY